MSSGRRRDHRRGGPSATNPLRIAKERLQSSARDFMRNLEDAVLSTSGSNDTQSTFTDGVSTGRREIQPAVALKEGAASIEHALRIMFSSCTGVGDNDLDIDDVSIDSPLEGDKRSRVTPVKPRKQLQASTPSTAGTSRSTPPSGAGRPSPGSQRDPGEHIYAQLFNDDNTRAKKVVETLQKHDSPEFEERRRQQMPPRNMLPKPFPISSPPRNVPVPSQELHLPVTPTFDDSISAISAHTLEAMANPKPVIKNRSGLSTLSKDSSTLFSAEPKGFVRNRSHGSASKHSLLSKGGQSRQSRTTHTTESTGASFDIWQAQEQQYWNDVVDDVGTRRSRSCGSKRSNRHPHDGFTAFFDDNLFIKPVVRKDFTSLPNGFIVKEDFGDLAGNNMGEI